MKQTPWNVCLTLFFFLQNREIKGVLLPFISQRILLYNNSISDCFKKHLEKRFFINFKDIWFILMNPKTQEPQCKLLVNYTFIVSCPVIESFQIRPWYISIYIKVLISSRKPHMLPVSPMMQPNPKHQVWTRQQDSFYQQSEMPSVSLHFSL